MDKSIEKLKPINVPLSEENILQRMSSKFLLLLNTAKFTKKHASLLHNTIKTGFFTLRFIMSVDLRMAMEIC